MGVRVGRKKRGGGKRKGDSGWTVPEHLLCASPDPLLFYPISSLDPHGSSMNLCSSSLCQQRNGVISLLVTEPGEKKWDWNPNPGSLTPERAGKGVSIQVDRAQGQEPPSLGLGPSTARDLCVGLSSLGLSYPICTEKG